MAELAHIGSLAVPDRLASDRLLRSLTWTLSAALALLGLRWAGVPLHDPTAPLLLVVVWCAVRDGWTGGVASAVVAIAVVGALIVFDGGAPGGGGADALVRVAVVALVAPAIAWLAAGLSRRARSAHEELEPVEGAPGLRASRVLAEALPQLVWSSTPDGGNEFANQRWLDFTGQTRAQVLDGGWSAAVHPNDLDLCVTRWTAAVASGAPFEAEYRLRAASGDYYWFLGRALPVRDAAGQVVRWIGTATNVHEQREAADAIRRWELAFQHSSLGVLIARGDATYITEANAALERMHGYEPGEMIGLPMENAFAIAARAQFLAQQALLGQVGRAVYESLHLRKDGTTFPVLIDVTAVRDADDREQYCVANILDLTETRAAEQAREAAELRFRAVQDASPDAFILWEIRDGAPGTEDASLIYCNPATERLLRKTRAELLGQRITVIFPDVRSAGRMERYLEVYRTGVTHDMTAFNEPLGVWLRMVVVKVGDGVGVIATDVSRVHVAQEVLRQSRDDLEQLVSARTRELHAARDAAIQANRAKSDFLSRASHELRTPLSSVIGFSNILLKNKRGALAAEELTYLARIAKNGRSLLALVNDLLDLSKIEAGRVDLELSPVSLFDLLHEVKETLEPRAGDLGLNLRVDVSLEHDIIIADEARLRQVLVNLVGNAVKYTTAGSVTVHVVCNAAGAPARIDIVDTGPGIAADRIDAIFEPFTVDATPAVGDAATGLGLTITRALCDLMGYRLSVKSRLGAGSTFSVHLLVAEAVRLRQIA